MKILRVSLKVIDSLSEWLGKLSSALILAVIGVVVAIVILRYGFNRPPPWSFDIPYMLYSSYFLLGVAWTLKMKGHVRIDIVYGRLSPRARALLDLFFDLIFFFPVFIAILYYAVDSVWYSWAHHERSIEGFWQPPIYHWKTVLPVSIFMLLLQGFAEFLRNLFRLLTEKEL